MPITCPARRLSLPDDPGDTDLLATLEGVSRRARCPEGEDACLTAGVAEGQSEATGRPRIDAFDDSGQPCKQALGCLDELIGVELDRIWRGCHPDHPDISDGRPDLKVAVRVSEAALDLDDISDAQSDGVTRCQPYADAAGLILDG